MTENRGWFFDTMQFYEMHGIMFICKMDSHEEGNISILWMERLNIDIICSIEQDHI